MIRPSYIFTSESVSEGHPDKVADRISDTVVDTFLAADPEARVACETMVTTNRIILGGEIRATRAGADKAGNTPLRYYKKHTHGGGVRAPLIVHWPRRVSPATPLRRQFHHVIDLAPTLAELAGTSFPDSYRGIEQLPVHGTSLAYTFADPAAPSTRQRQYFETAGYRGIVVGEWKAVAVHQPGTPFDAKASSGASAFVSGASAFAAASSAVNGVPRSTAVSRIEATTATRLFLSSAALAVLRASSASVVFKDCSSAAMR